MQSVKYRFGRGILANKFPANDYVKPSIGSERKASFNSNGRSTHSVTIENIPDHIDRREVVNLFGALIGEVRGFQDIRETLNPRLEITFADKDTASKAICMNGYTVAGVPLKVNALITSPISWTNKTLPDDRRNLYVLGLPFALTKSEFASAFAQYGTVSHCVILATVDNSSRRRGFIVMSTHEEARQAMAALTRTQIKGHTIDVSWAVVQRSQGKATCFLDGGDRSMLLESRGQLRSPSPKSSSRHTPTSSLSSNSSLGSQEPDTIPLTMDPLPTKSLLVTNLPTLLFSQVQDLHPLFAPFGHIEKLEIVQAFPLGNISALVQYSYASVAQEAKDHLTGQVYGTHRIEAHFVRSPVLDIQHTMPLAPTTIHNKSSTCYTSGISMPSMNLLDWSSLHCDGSMNHGAGPNSPACPSEHVALSGPLAMHSRQSSLSAMPPLSGSRKAFEGFAPASTIPRWDHDQNLGYLSDSRSLYPPLLQRSFSNVYSTSTA